MKKLTLLTLTALFGLANSHLCAQTVWTGNINNDWDDDGNWSAGEPVLGTTAEIGLSGANVVMTTGINRVRDIRIGATSGVATLNIEAGGDMRSDGTWRIGVAGFDNGVVNQTGGNFLIVGGSRDMRLGTDSNGAFTGTFNFGGTQVDSPTFDFSGARNILVGSFAEGNLVLTDYGTFTASNIIVSQNDGTGLFSVKGGNLSISAADLTFNNGLDGTGTLRAILDSSGFSPITVSGTVNFNDGTTDGSLFDLELDASYVHQVGTTFEIINANAFGGDLEFSNVTDGQILEVDGNQFEAGYDSGVFSITAIPEPSSATLVLLGVGVVMLRKKSKK